MEIQLPSDLQATVEGLVAAGRFSTIDDAVCMGIRMLASAEKLRADVQVGIDQADRGELVDHDTVFARLQMLSQLAQDNAVR